DSKRTIARVRCIRVYARRRVFVAADGPIKLRKIPVNIGLKAPIPHTWQRIPRTPVDSSDDAKPEASCLVEASLRDQGIDKRGELWQANQRVAFDAAAHCNRVG